MPRKPAKKPAKAAAKHVDKSGPKSEAGVLVAQPHGGAIKRGGDHPRPGRPPNVVRAVLAHEAAEGVPMLRDILRGEPIKRATIPLSAVLRHAKCPKCGGALERRPDDPAGSTPAQLVTIEGVESASPGDRVRAWDAFAKYGIGTKDEVTVISPAVRERVAKTVQVIAQQETWQSAALLDHLDTIWRDEVGP